MAIRIASWDVLGRIMVPLLLLQLLFQGSEDFGYRWDSFIVSQEERVLFPSTQGLMKTARVGL